ncbi:hypothetical protein CUMW_258870 [Citrus unshiu]|nr:hypothetical protein CUMW_258870 [Citrus unshiu]
MTRLNKNEDEITVTEPKISKQTEGAQSSIDGQGEDEYYARYWPLYRMIEKNDWRGVEDFVTNHPDALTAKIVEPGSRTIFHTIAELLVDDESDEATCLLDKLAAKVDPQTLARQDYRGHTAVIFCAAKGNLKALKVLLKYNPDLTNIWGSNGYLPVHNAAYYGHKDTFQYLLEATNGVDIYRGNDGANVLFSLIAANLYAPSIKLIHDQKLTHMRTVEIVRIICEAVVWTNVQTSAQLSGAMLSAAILGIPEVVNEFIMAYNSCSNWSNQDGHTIFDYAVLYRREKVFNLIQGVNFTTFLFSSRDKASNNILHLAGRLVPSSEVAGAALQMQRELQWFKAIENLVHPYFREATNNLRQTPREVFTKEHKELVKEGEKWMKETASSCSVVAALIITVVFAAAFTVPGGIDGRGVPNLLREKSFMICAISDMLALFSSITSVLMFLGILSSRYAEDDFLVSLPRKLIIGLVALFFSIASMMVAFGATVHISLSHKWNLVIIPVALVGCVPITLFAFLQFPLLLDMCFSTYGRGIIIDSSWRELASCDLVAKGN